MTQEAFKDLLDAVEAAIQAGDWKVDGACDPDLAIRRAKEALAQTQEPDDLTIAYMAGVHDGKKTQRTWVKLMRGVRVEGDSVVISVKGGNEAARELCNELLKEKNT